MPPFTISRRFPWNPDRSKKRSTCCSAPIVSLHKRDTRTRERTTFSETITSMTSRSLCHRRNLLKRASWTWSTLCWWRVVVNCFLNWICTWGKSHHLQVLSLAWTETEKHLCQIMEKWSLKEVSKFALDALSCSILPSKPRLLFSHFSVVSPVASHGIHQSPFLPLTMVAGFLDRK